MPTTCPDCGVGTLRYVVADIHTHYTDEFTVRVVIDGPSDVVTPDEAHWEDLGDDCGQVVEEYVECPECHGKTMYLGAQIIL